VSGEPDIIRFLLIKHSSRPPFQIWLVSIMILAIYYLYRRWNIRLKELKPAMETLFVILVSIILYNRSLSLYLSVCKYGHVYSLPYTSILLFLAVFLWSVSLIIDGNIIFSHNQLAYSYLYTSVVLLIIAAFLFLVLSPFYSFDPRHHKGIVQSIIGMFLFATLMNAQFNTVKKRGRLKLVLSVILGVVILVSWIYELRIFNDFSLFKIFE